jgi:hypothetical protein
MPQQIKQIHNIGMSKSELDDLPQIIQHNILEPPWSPSDKIPCSLQVRMMYNSTADQVLAKMDDPAGLGEYKA